MNRRRRIVRDGSSPLRRSAAFNTTGDPRWHPPRYCHDCGVVEGCGHFTWCPEAPPVDLIQDAYHWTKG
jgi:hypothetical protein